MGAMKSLSLTRKLAGTRTPGSFLEPAFPELERQATVWGTPEATTAWLAWIRQRIVRDVANAFRLPVELLRDPEEAEIAEGRINAALGGMEEDKNVG